jgi:UPF0755 protein
MEPIRVPQPRSNRSRRSAFSRVFASLFGLVLLAGLVATAAGFYAFAQFTAQGPLKAKTVYVVNPGMGRAEIGAALEDAGIVNSAMIFTAASYADRLRGKSLKPGEYEFASGASIDDVLGTISSGRTIAYKITVPEGWTTQMAVARLTENDVLTGEVTTIPPEGAILPDTYVFRRGLTRQKMLDDMKDAQAKMLETLWSSRAQNSVLKTKEEAVTLASIVEKETGVPEERPLVASVFLNRLKQGIKLQSDPTIIYGLVGGKGKLDHALTKDDLNSDTPFNTYKISGLPPSPIANPGKASLEAVLNPPDTGYLYFVANGTGGHAFAKTLEEHNANVAKWRAIEGGQAAVVTTEAPTEVVVDGMPTPATPKVEAAAPAVAPDLATPVEPAKPAETATIVEPAKPTEPAKPVDAAKPVETTKPVDPAKPAVETSVNDKPLKPGTLVKIADRLVPIPRQKPKK